MTDGPLTGVRVLDLTHVLAGPYATGQLALMGADVIRIERPDSDDFVRRHGGTDDMRDAGLGASFLSQNSGKRSVVLNLKDPEDREKLLRLAETSDVFVENFRPGVVDRLGVGFEAVKERRGNIIYASLNGYGPEGPLSDRPAYDHILQGISGLMAMTGDTGSGPMRVGLPIVDYIAGQALVAALLAALLQKTRKPNEAQRVSVSMLDAMTTMMGAYAIHHQTTGKLRGLEGNRAFADTPFSGRFDTQEGALVVTANTTAQARRLSEAVDRPDLINADDVTIATTLGAIFKTKDAQAWEEVLSAANVPAARVRTMAEAMNHPQLKHSSAWLPLHVPQLGKTVRAPALPFRAAWGPERLDPVPTLGQHTVDVLDELMESASS